MISAAELRRLAGAWNVDFTVIERDYVLSWVLAGLYRQPVLTEGLVFKGGTALRKCYFPDYRFSADLDFTLRTSPPAQELRAEIEVACRTITEETGIRLVPVDFTLRDVPDEEACTELEYRQAGQSGLERLSGAVLAWALRGEL